MSIAECIKEIAAEHFAGYGFIFANWHEADERLNTTPCPFILTLLPVDGAIRKKNGRAWLRETYMIGFFDKVPRGASGEDNVKVYESMRELAKRFIASLVASNKFNTFSETVRFSPWFEKFTDIVSGVVVTLDLEIQEECK